MTDTLQRGAVDLVSAGELEKKLGLGRPLRVKLGVDPTTPELHLGHTVVLQKLRAFQDAGHTAVLIIGDFTARVGDPSGRDSTRPSLSPEKIRENAQSYKEQAFKVLRPDRTELRYNSEWLEPFIAGGLLKTLQLYTVGQLLAREDFQQRMKANGPISLLEILYPLLQGYDSVAVRADVELGGTDQLFNLLMGRTMQKDAGQAPQVVLTVPLLVGLDGEKKMSKSYGNHIGLNEPARELFGKVMKLDDAAMLAYFELLTDQELSEVRGRHPMEAKKDLAELLTARYHGPEAGRAERDYFEAAFSRREAPADAAEHALTAEERGLAWSALLVKMGAVKSRREAQRLIGQGAVRAGEEKLLKDEPVERFLAGPGGRDGVISLKVGRHKFYRVRVG